MGVAQALDVVANFGGEAAGPEADRTRHRLLHVRVTRQDDVALLLGQRLQRRGHAPGVVGQRFDGIAQVQPQCSQYLVIPRAAGV
jgi:hypothetical protein